MCKNSCSYHRFFVILLRETKIMDMVLDLQHACAAECLRPFFVTEQGPAAYIARAAAAGRHALWTFVPRRRDEQL